jgi:hypothetical protein
MLAGIGRPEENNGEGYFKNSDSAGGDLYPQKSHGSVLHAISIKNLLGVIRI